MNKLKMNTASFLFSVVAIIGLSAFSIQQSMEWKIAEGYSIKFTSSDPTGVFTKMSGDISFDPANLDVAKFDVKVDVSSINTGNGTQNKHAKSAKWFDAETYPTINFTSSKFNKTATGYSVDGMIEIHGVKKEFTMPFTFKNNVFSSSYMINRMDFGVGSMKGMSKKVPAELQVDISVPVTK